MNHKSVAKEIAGTVMMPRFVIEIILDVLSTVIKNELAKGNPVQLDNIGTFHIVDSNNMNNKKRVKLKPHAVIKAAINEELNE